MKKIIESNDLHRIAEEILHNALMLSMTDSDSVEDDISFYLPVIQNCASDLKEIAEVSEPAQEGAQEAR